MCSTGVTLFVRTATFPVVQVHEPVRMMTTAQHGCHPTHPCRSLSSRPASLTFTRTPVYVSDVSPREECLGIQGTGKNADICCAAECTCACGGDVADNEGKDCFLTQIRAEPPGMCTGAEVNAACVLEPGT